MSSEFLTEKVDGLIYDVGMCQGEDTDFFLKKGFRVIAFEADPANLAHCKRRFQDEIQKGDLVIVEGAIVDQEYLAAGGRTIKFYRNLDLAVWGTTVPARMQVNEDRGTRHEIIEVPVVDLVECLRKHGIPHYMKIDIEGAEAVCLNLLHRFRMKPDYISLESEKNDRSKLLEEIGTLERLGYTGFKVVHQGTVPAQTPPHPSLEGKYVPYRFLPGCSGLFGRDLPGKWKNKTDILKEYARIFLEHRYFGHYSFLRKTRAGRFLVKILGKLLGRPVPGWQDCHGRHATAA